MTRPSKKERAAVIGRLDRAQAILDALAFLAVAGPTVFGATLLLPSGEAIYIPKATARSSAATEGRSQ